MVGSKVLASDINSVFLKLEALRVEHYGGTGQSSTGTSSLSTAFNTNVATQEEQVIEPYTLMKQYLNTLRQSVFLTSITEAQVNQITVPSAGSLLEFANLEVASDLIETIDNLPVGYNTNFSGFNGANFGTNFTCQSNFGTNFTCRANFGSNFGSNFSGHNSSNRATPFVCLRPFTPFFSSL